MESKLFQKKSYCINNSLEGLDGQQENTVIEPGEHVALSPVLDQSFNRIAARHGTRTTTTLKPRPRVLPGVTV